ncbi:MAG: hypothetical protein ACK5BV_05975, partial [Bacteroidota bacterium]
NKVTVTTVGLQGSPLASLTTIFSTITCMTDNLEGKERGVCYSLSSNSVTIQGNRVSSGSGVGSYTTTLTNLLSGRVYYYRSYIIYDNPGVVFYGDIKTFSTPTNNCPVVTTSNLVRINSNTANLGGNVTSDGGSFVSNRGILISLSNTNPTIGQSDYQSPTIGSGTGVYSTNVSGFSPGMRCYVRAYAINANCTSYGNTISFVW